jgi:hypothetical protein
MTPVRVQVLGAEVKREFCEKPRTVDMGYGVVGNRSGQPHGVIGKWVGAARTETVEESGIHSHLWRSTFILR